MKGKFYTILGSFFLLMGVHNSICGQHQLSDIPLKASFPFADFRPGMNQFGNELATPPALWDIQFVYDIQDSAGLVGSAGLLFTGTEFWVSRWAGDSLLNFDQNGSLISIFTIPTVTGIRGLTWDGTFVYAGNNTNTIYKIDPVSKTVSSTINAPLAVRNITFDSTTNGGAGGFWIGNWDTDLLQISMNGITQNTITAATHGLTEMYGTAFDNFTNGGPYLWVFDQGGASNCRIVRLQLPTGGQTLAQHDVMTDVGVQEALTGGLAGGLFITDQLVGGNWTICGVIQGTPNDILFGYELNDFVPPAVDGSLDTVAIINRYTKLPLDHATALSFSGVISNTGLNTLNTVNFDLNLKRGVTSVFTDTQSSNNLTSGTNVNLISNSYSATQKGNYTAEGTVSLTGQTDLVSSNNNLNYSFEITDSTYSRDDGVANGNDYNVGGTDWAWATTNFFIPVADTLTSISIQLQTPLPGDTTYGVVASADLDGIPISILEITPITIISGGVDYVLVFPGGVALAPGNWAIGVYEGLNTGINLAQSNNVYSPGVNYFYTPTDGWVPSGIATSRFIRPNFGNISVVGADEKINQNEFEVWPVPASEILHLRFYDSPGEFISITLSEIQGREVLRFGFNIENGNFVQDLNLVELNNGVYFLTVHSPSGNFTKKVIIAD